jgi:hypothetical protein
MYHLPLQDAPKFTQIGIFGFENIPSGNPGADVMITIFCDFSQFSAKKMTFFSKTNVMIKILHIIALF